MNDVATKSDPMADFQAKLQQRVRDDIRDLLPEDAVAALVQKAVENEFFKPRVVPQQYGGSEEHPSWFVETVVKAAKPIMEQAVAKCIADNPETVEKVIREFLNQDRLAVLTATRLTEMLSSAVFSLQEQFRQQR